MFHQNAYMHTYIDLTLLQCILIIDGVGVSGSLSSNLFSDGAENDTSCGVTHALTRFLTMAEVARILRGLKCYPAAQCVSHTDGWRPVTMITFIDSPYWYASSSSIASSDLDDRRRVYMRVCRHGPSRRLNPLLCFCVAGPAHRPWRYHLLQDNIYSPQALVSSVFILQNDCRCCFGALCNLRATRPQSEAGREMTM